MKILKYSMIAIAELTAAIVICYAFNRLGRRVEIAEVRVCDKVMIFGRSDGDCVKNATLTPFGVSVFHGGGNMATCDKYQARKCWMSGATEGNVTCGGDCSRCSIGSEKKLLPSFAELASEYMVFADNSGIVRPNTAANKIYALNSLYRFSRLTPDDKVSALTDDVWEEFKIEARQHLSDESIKGIGERIHSLLSSKSIRFFKTSKGWDCDRFPRLDAESKIKQWKSLTRDQRRKIRDWQFGLYELSDPRKYLCVTAAWERGQRKCDALRNHWSQFQERDGVIWWPYVSVKNGKTSEWPVDPDTWRMLMVAKRKLGAVRQRHLGSFPDSYMRVREFGRNEVATSAIWDSCGDDLRDLMGWDGSKSMHNLRKDACDTIFQNLGVDEAEEFSTDTAKTLRKHYIAKKRIMPNIPSIAKM